MGVSASAEGGLRLPGSHRMGLGGGLLLAPGATRCIDADPAPVSTSALTLDGSY